MKIKVVLFFVFILISSVANAGTIEKWSEPPRDIYFHAGGSAVCTSTLGLHMKKNGQLKQSAMIKSFVFCTLLGAIKEYVSDEKPSQRELLLNFGGNFVGLLVIEFY